MSEAEKTASALHDNGDQRYVRHTLFCSIDLTEPEDIPPELLDAIFKNLCSDASTLQSCAVVNKAWLSASRVHLFKHVDLTIDNEPLVSSILSSSPHLASYAKKLDIRRLKWCGSRIPSRISLLSHFSVNLTEIHVEDVTFDDFQHLADLVSLFPSLQVISLLRVTWDNDTVTRNPLRALDTPRTPVKVKKGLPTTLSSLRAHHVNIGTLASWFLMHPEVPQLSRLSWGPVEPNFVVSCSNYIALLGPRLKNLSLLLPPEGRPHAPYAYYSPPSGVGEELDSMKHLVKRHIALYGVRPTPVLRSHTVLETIHFHRFLCDAIERDQTGDFYAPKTLAALTSSSLRWIILDVEMSKVSDLDRQEIPWSFMEEIFDCEIYSRLEGVVFRVLSEINMVALEDLLSQRLPITYKRGILKFQKVAGSLRYADVTYSITSNY